MLAELVAPNSLGRFVCMSRGNWRRRQLIIDVIDIARVALDIIEEDLDVLIVALDSDWCVERYHEGFI